MASTDTEQNEEEPAVEDEDTGAQIAPIVRLEEVAVTTGEENEDAILDLKAKLYRFDKDGNQWKERGDGSVKILKHKETGKLRLAMRQSETLKICANHIVFPRTLVQQHAANEKSCVWHAADFADGELKDELFCIRFGSIENIVSQDQGYMYFTNILSQDSDLGPTYVGQSGTSPLSLDDSPLLHLNDPTSVRKSGRGVNFTHEEDKLLVSAWLNCSLVAVHGTYAKHSKLWDKIFEYFQQFKETTTERTIKSLIHRWSVIQKATNKFCAKLAQAEGLNQSGMTEQDKLEKARIMYRSLEKCNFQFEHCWHLLKDQPKWILRLKYNARQTKTMFPSPTRTPTQCSADVDDSAFNLETENVIENEVIELDQLTGRKAEKRKRKAKRRQVEENFQLRKMRYALLEESRAQEREFYRLRAEKMEYDKEKERGKLRLEDKRLRLEAEKLRIEAENEQSKVRQEDERLRLEAEKIELAKKESDNRIMMMDVSVMSEMQRSYFEELQKEIMMRRIHALNDQL